MSTTPGIENPDLLGRLKELHLLLLDVRDQIDRAVLCTEKGICSLADARSEGGEHGQ